MCSVMILYIYIIDGNPYGHLIWGDGTHNIQIFLEALYRHGYKAYLGQEITEFDYFNNPAEADIRNMRAYEKYI